MDKLNWERSLERKRLYFDDFIIYKIVNSAFYLLIQGIVVCWVGVLIIIVLAFYDISPGYLVGLIGLLFFSVVLYQYFQSRKLIEIEVNQPEIKTNIKKYFQEKNWLVIEEASRFIHFIKRKGRIDEHVYIIYKERSLLIASIIEIPFPFSFLKAASIRNEIIDIANNRETS